MKALYFSLNLSAEECLAYYQGNKHTIVARAKDGRTVQFPADIIRRFVTQTGLQGDFRLDYGDDHKLIRIEKLA